MKLITDKKDLIGLEIASIEEVRIDGGIRMLCITFQGEKIALLECDSFYESQFVSLFDGELDNEDKASLGITS